MAAVRENLQAILVSMRIDGIAQIFWFRPRAIILLAANKQVHAPHPWQSVRSEIQGNTIRMKKRILLSSFGINDTRQSNSWQPTAFIAAFTHIDILHHLSRIC